MKMYFFFDRESGASGLVSARTSGKARYKLVLAANDAGYSTSFADIRLARRPSLDHLADPPRILTDWEVEAEMLKQQKANGAAGATGTNE